MDYLWATPKNKIMKFTLLLMLLGLTVLSCKKETKVDNTTIADSTVIDTVPSDTMAAPANPMPADTMRTGDAASVKKMDSAKTTKK
jgi:hypothetical protein